jgi:DNA-binding MarR family transcriptional regulator
MQVPDPVNRSAKLVTLTATGQRNVASALRIFERIEADLAERIGVDSVAALRAALEAHWEPPLAPASLRPPSPAEDLQR